jgi:hypothetical protein
VLAGGLTPGLTPTEQGHRIRGKDGGDQRRRWRCRVGIARGISALGGEGGRVAEGTRRWGLGRERPQALQPSGRAGGPGTASRCLPLVVGGTCGRRRDLAGGHGWSQGTVAGGLVPPVPVADRVPGCDHRRPPADAVSAQTTKDLGWWWTGNWSRGPWGSCGPPWPRTGTCWSGWGGWWRRPGRWSGGWHRPDPGP